MTFSYTPLHAVKVSKYALAKLDLARAKCVCADKCQRILETKVALVTKAENDDLEDNARIQP